MRPAPPFMENILSAMSKAFLDDPRGSVSSVQKGCWLPLFLPPPPPHLKKSPGQEQDPGRKSNEARQRDTV